MPEFLCIHCGTSLTGLAKKKLDMLGQVYIMWLVCPKCEKATKFHLSYAIMLKDVTAEKVAHPVESQKANDG
jgi:hypothetical protein